MKTGKMFRCASIGCALMAAMVLFASCDNSAKNGTWARIYYNENKGEETTARAIMQTGDGNSIILTYEDIVKIDQAGTILWQKHYPSAYFISIAETPDGGLVAAGRQCLMKLDANGAILWSKRLAGRENDGVYCTRFNYDRKTDSFVVDGFILGSGFCEEVFVARIDSSGALAGKKIIRNYDYDFGHSRITPDGGFIKACSAPAENIIALVIRMAPDGTIQWQKTYDAVGGFRNLAAGSTESYGVSIENTGDGGFMLAGTTRVFDNDVMFTWIARLDAGGNPTWVREIQNITGGSDINLAYLRQNYQDVPFSLSAAADGGYVLAGNSLKMKMLNLTPQQEEWRGLLYYYGSGWIVKLDSAAKIQWQKYYMDNLVHVPTDGEGGSITFYATSIIMNAVSALSSGGYMLGGSTTQYAPGADESPYSSSLVLKTDGKGNIADTGLKVNNGSAKTLKVGLLVNDAQNQIDDTVPLTLVDQALEMEMPMAYSAMGI